MSSARSLIDRRVAQLCGRFDVAGKIVTVKQSADMFAILWGAEGASSAPTCLMLTTVKASDMVQTAAADTPPVFTLGRSVSVQAAYATMLGLDAHKLHEIPICDARIDFDFAALPGIGAGASSSGSKYRVAMTGPGFPHPLWKGAKTCRTVVVHVSEREDAAHSLRVDGMVSWVDGRWIETYEKAGVALSPDGRFVYTVVPCGEDGTAARKEGAYPADVGLAIRDVLSTSQHLVRLAATHRCMWTVQAEQDGAGGTRVFLEGGAGQDGVFREAVLHSPGLSRGPAGDRLGTMEHDACADCGPDAVSAVLAADGDQSGRVELPEWLDLEGPATKALGLSEDDEAFGYTACYIDALRPETRILLRTEGAHVWKTEHCSANSIDEAPLLFVGASTVGPISYHTTLMEGPRAWTFLTYETRMRGSRVCCWDAHPDGDANRPAKRVRRK